MNKTIEINGIENSELEASIIITAEDVEALYRRGQEIGGEAALILNDRTGELKVRTLMAASISGYRVICDFGHLLETDHSGTSSDAWDAEMFHLAAEQINEWESER